MDVSSRPRPKWQLEFRESQYSRYSTGSSSRRRHPVAHWLWRGLRHDEEKEGGLIHYTLIAQESCAGHCGAAFFRKEKLLCIGKPTEDLDFTNQLNLVYARDYTVWKDVELFFKSVTVK